MYNIMIAAITAPAHSQARLSKASRLLIAAMVVTVLTIPVIAEHGCPAFEAQCI
ncbi:hypothetical protein BGZ65_002769, partial [Modicella reniformis]